MTAQAAANHWQLTKPIRTLLPVSSNNTASPITAPFVSAVDPTFKPSARNPPARLLKYLAQNSANAGASDKSRFDRD
jgi:hypothetical protein